jgi:membrane protein
VADAAPTPAERFAHVPVLGTALAVQQRYQEDGADQLAAAIGFFGFLSLVPLLLLAVAGAGYLWDDPERQVEIAATITASLPGLETALGAAGGTGGADAFVETIVAQRATLGTVGLLLLLPTGLKVVASAMTATRVVFRGAVLRGVGARVRQLLAMVGLGVLALGAAGASSLAGTLTGTLPGLAAAAIGFAATFALDLALFLAAYVLLSPSSHLSARSLLPGAVLGAAGWAALKVAGSAFVANQIEGANALYGAAGGIVALLLLLYLAGRLYLYGAELSAVRAERRGIRFADPQAAGGVAGIVPAHLQADASDGPRRDARPGSTAASPASGSSGSSGSSAAGRSRAPARSPRQPSGVVSAGTRARLADAEAARAAALEQRDRSGDARTAVALTLTAGALAAAWRLLGDRD